jgi:hypothetical protein
MWCCLAALPKYPSSPAREHRAHSTQRCPACCAYLSTQPLASAAQVRTLENGIEWNVDHPGPLSGIASAAGDPGEFFEDFCNWQRVPEYREVMLGRGSATSRARALHMALSNFHAANNVEFARA